MRWLALGLPLLLSLGCAQGTLPEHKGRFLVCGDRYEQFVQEVSRTLLSDGFELRENEDMPNLHPEMRGYFFANRRDEVAVFMVRAEDKGILYQTFDEPFPPGRFQTFQKEFDSAVDRYACPLQERQ